MGSMKWFCNACPAVAYNSDHIDETENILKKKAGVESTWASEGEKITRKIKTFQELGSGVAKASKKGADVGSKWHSFHRMG